MADDLSNLTRDELLRRLTAVRAYCGDVSLCVANFKHYGLSPKSGEFERVLNRVVDLAEGADDGTYVCG